MQENWSLESKHLFLCIKYSQKSSMKYGYARVSPGGKSESVQA
jgi:hypothetical protein